MVDGNKKNSDFDAFHGLALLQSAFFGSKQLPFNYLPIDLVRDQKWLNYFFFSKMMTEEFESQSAQIMQC